MRAKKDVIWAFSQHLEKCKLHLWESMAFRGEQEQAHMFDTHVAAVLRFLGTSSQPEGQWGRWGQYPQGGDRPATVETMDNYIGEDPKGISPLTNGLRKSALASPRRCPQLCSPYLLHDTCYR